MKAPRARPRRATGARAWGSQWSRSSSPELTNLAPPAQQRAQVAHRPQVPQLVRVDDRAHALDLALCDVEDRHADRPALAVDAATIVVRYGRKRRLRRWTSIAMSYIRISCAAERALGSVTGVVLQSARELRSVRVRPTSTALAEDGNDPKYFLPEDPGNLLRADPDRRSLVGFASAGDAALLPEYAQAAYDAALGPKELVWIETHNHIELYDQDPYVSEAAAHAIRWLDGHLAGKRRRR